VLCHILFFCRLYIFTAIKKYLKSLHLESLKNKLPCPCSIVLQLMNLHAAYSLFYLANMNYSYCIAPGIFITGAKSTLCS